MKIMATTCLAILLGVPMFAAPEECNLLANGSFEYWADYTPEFRAGQLRYKGTQTAAPLRWELDRCMVTQAADAHTGSFSGRVGSGCSLQMRSVELNPRSTYAFGAWVKAAGNDTQPDGAKVRVDVIGHAFEGEQVLASATGPAGADWTELRGSVTIPGHIRLVDLRITLPKGVTALVDDAFLTAPLDAPFDASDVLGHKYGRDEHTIFYEDFDGPRPDILFSGKDPKSGITKEDQGRFGRGVRMEKQEYATLPLDVKTMPREGTLEFWFMPGDDSPRGVTVDLLSARGRLFAVTQHPTMGWKLKRKGGTGKEKGFLSAPFLLFGRHRERGSWMHAAVCWDADAVRFYIDGALMRFQKVDQPQWTAPPVVLQLGSALSQDSCHFRIDEIRLSDVKRYGPFVPSGDQFTPFPDFADLAQAGDTPAPVAPVKPVVDPKEAAAALDKARKELITHLRSGDPGRYENEPNTAGEYVYEAASLKPLVTGSKCSVVKDKPAEGLTLVNFGGCRPVHCLQPDIEGVYWKLGAIKPGKYYVAFQYQGREPGLFLNGRIVQVTSARGIGQVAPNFSLTEFQVDQPLELKKGDELAVQTLFSGSAWLGALLLRPESPGPGDNPVATQFGGGNRYLYTAHCVGADAWFSDRQGQRVPLLENMWRSTQATARPSDLERDAAGDGVLNVRLANPLSVPVTLDYQCDVLSYYRLKVGGETERITLNAHEAVIRKVPFTIVPDEPAYSAVVKIEAVDPPTLDWPEGDEVSFFQGLRHSVAWPNPWKHTMLQRVDFTQPVDSPRHLLNLDGPWEMAYTSSLEAQFPIPSGLTFTTFVLPGSFHGRPERTSADQHAAYFRRTFTLPETSTNRSHKVFVERVRDEGTVWVNGQKIGNVRGGNTPLRVDATQAIKPGENEIVILVRDLTVLMNPDYVNWDKPVPNHLYQDTPGYASAHKGPGIGSVELVTAPLVCAEELQALPSFRKKQLSARFNLKNLEREPVKVNVKTSVLDQGEPVLVVDEREMVLQPDQLESLIVEKKWDNPRLWGAQDPHLYVLAVEIFDAANGERLDLARARFGFREVWVEGPHLMLNGVPMRPKGMLSPRDEVVTITRGPMYGLEEYDETGRMSYRMVTGFHNSASRYNLESDKYWANGETNALQCLKQWINHPSIIAWDLSNEWLCYCDRYAPDPQLPGKRFKKVSDAIRAYDPTRITIANAEGDLMGLLDNHCYHYMTPTQGGKHVIPGVHACLPDAEYWRPLDRNFEPGKGVQHSPIKPTILRPDLKPIINSEHLWKVGSTMPPGLTEVCGEADLLGSAVDYESGPAVWFWKQKCDGNRDLGVGPIHHYQLPGMQSRANTAITVLIPDVAHNGFSGQPFKRLYKIINDTLNDLDLTLKWELLADDGKVVAKGEKTHEVGSGSAREGIIEFVLPRVAQRDALTLKTRLYDGKKFVQGQELDLGVWPDQAINPGDLKRNVMLFDPRGATAEALTAAGVRFDLLDRLTPAPGAPRDSLLLIGENALDEESAATGLKLMDYVENGGRVLVLAQHATLAGLPAATKLSPSRWASMVFNRLPIHPVMAGVSPWDLKFWANDRIVARGAYAKPESGAFVTLIDSGSTQDREGLEYVHLMEQFRGEGHYLLCQLPLIEKIDQEPMAGEMLARLLRYAANGERFAKPTGKLKAVLAANSPLLKRFEKIGVDYDATGMEGPFAPGEAILIEAGRLRQATAPQKAALAKALRDGARVVVTESTPEDAEWLSELAGTEVRLTVQPSASWHGRGVRKGYSPYTAGLSHQDFYWKRFSGSERALNQAGDPELAIEAFQDYAARCDQARERVRPGALLELPVGQGVLLIDQRRLTTEDAALAKLADRNVSALALGLGVKMKPTPPKRQLPKEIDYRPIDLRPFANRSLQDEKASDGEGGWSDQGAGADLRDFKTGKINCQGVPFLVGDHPQSCIVLKNVKRPHPEKFPSEVTIPIEHAVEGFYFLHGFAYCGDKPIGVYQVQYADGRTYDIRIIGRVNAMDWISGPRSGFPHEKDTKTSVAWTGTCAMFPVITVYKTLWVNPRPETPVKAIRFFKTPDMQSVHVFMGLTEVLKREDKTLNAAQQAEVADLMKQAAERAKSNKPDEALALFRRALAINPRKWDAWQQSADLLEQKADEDAILEHYYAWIRAGAESPFPYNRVAEILEKRKDPRSALEFYRRSLQVEWNQPPIMQNVQRLENEVK